MGANTQPLGRAEEDEEPLVAIAANCAKFADGSNGESLRGRFRCERGQRKIRERAEGFCGSTAQRSAMRTRFRRDCDNYDQSICFYRLTPVNPITQYEEQKAIMKIFKFSLFTLGALAILSITGCSTGPSAWNIKVTQTTPGSIQVDLVGITEAEKPKWEAYSMDSYWNNENDPRRMNALKLTHFLVLNKPWVVSKDDPIWQKWFSHGDTELAIIANLPGNFPSGPGDPRLNFYPLNSGAWDAKKHTLIFEVQDTIVNPVTPQKNK